MTPSPETGATGATIGDAAGLLLGDRYRLGDPLGEGGMGVVYRAHDTMLRRTVAVKVFRAGAAETARTATETRLLAGLNHPALVTLYDAHVGADEPRYLVMEYVDGPTLQSRLRSGPLSDPTALRIARDLAEALHAAHQAGIVHRDVKPANVLLRASSVPGEEFHAKLADFGIAHLVDTTRLTVPGTIIGSAAYLSPEQVTGATPLPSSDIYSLGLVLIEALTGERSFAQEGMREAVLARLSQDPAIPASVGHDWGALLTAMTARDPALRPTALDVMVGVRNLSSPVAVTASPETTVRVPSGPTTEITAETVEEDPADATGTRTAVFGATHETIGSSDSDSDSAVAPGSRRRRRRWIAALALASVVVVAATIGGVSMLAGSAQEPVEPPTLPTVEEPLAAHLQQLLDAVSP